jgi:hypothetical protein
VRDLDFPLLEDDYAEAYAEWNGTADESMWETVAADGVER